MNWQPHNGSGILLPESLRESFLPVAGHGMGGADWREPLYDESAINYLVNGLWSPEDEQYDRAGFETEQELAFARRLGRYLARKSAHAINCHENRISYIVGWGHRYAVVPRKSVAVARKLNQEIIAAVQAEIDEFCRLNKWNRRQQEIVRRRDRDGECFLRFFVVGEREQQRLVVRFVEPMDVRNPSSTADSSEAKSIRLGVQHDPNDAETIVAYWIDHGDNKPRQVEAKHVQHRKGNNVDCNVFRGCPLLWPVLENLRSIPKIRRNMMAGSAIQTSVAMVKKLTDVTKAGARQLQEDGADFQTASPITGAMRPHEIQRPGKIVKASANIDYEFPFSNTRYDQYVAVLRDNLLEVASMVVMPEFMFTSNAENGNYSSTMVAEGPAVKNFERLQNNQIEEDLEVMDRVLDVAVQAGRLPEGIHKLVEIECEPPSMVVRDRLQEAQENQIYSAMRIKSKQTISQQQGLDYDQEQSNIADDEANFGGTMPIGMGGPADGGQPTIAGPFAESRLWLREDCGTGAGGFKSGNACAGGGGGGGESGGSGKKKPANKKKPPGSNAAESKAKSYKSGSQAETELSQSTKPWRDGLDFDDTAGIKAYAGSSTSFDVNKGLREGKFSNPTAKVTAERMTKALDKADFPDTVTTYRSINPKTPEEREVILSKFRQAQGGEIVDKAFVSSTANKKYADTWGKNSPATPIKCEVIVPKGAKAAYLPKELVGRQEWEVVIQKNSKYRVKEVVGDTIRLELLP